MNQEPSPALVMGDVGKLLLEKVKKKEKCVACQVALMVGDDVAMYDCGHCVHSYCGLSDNCPSTTHEQDMRLSIRLFVRPGLPKKRHVTIRSVNQSPSPPPPPPLPNTLPILTRGCIDRHWFANLAAGGVPTLPPRRDGPESEYECDLCKTKLLTNQAIYKHRVCGKVLDFQCLLAYRTGCLLCGQPYITGKELRRVDRSVDPLVMIVSSSPE